MELLYTLFRVLGLLCSITCKSQVHTVKLCPVDRFMIRKRCNIIFLAVLVSFQIGKS